MTLPLVVTAVMLAGVAAVVAVSYVLAWRIIRPGRHTYWDEYTFLPSDMGVPYEDVRFATRDGLRLAGWLMPRPGSVAAIVMASGYRDRKTSLLPVAAGLWRHGFSIFLFDFRNQGDSAMDNMQTMGWRERADMKAALDVAAARLPGQRIGALGWSMGAAVALLTAARDERIAAVVADSAFADQPDVIAFNFTQATRLPAWPFTAIAMLFICLLAGYWPQEVRPVDAIGAIAPRPLLIIHGERDDMCHVRNAHRLHAAAGAPRDLWLLPNVKHVGAYFADPAAYIARVAAFFAQSLGQAS